MASLARNLYGMNRLTKAFACLVFVCLLAILLQGTAKALTVSPVKAELEIDPGKRLHSKLVLTNEEQDTKIYYLSVQNFNAKDESGVPQFSPKNDGLASWVEIESKVVLGPKEQKDIPYSIAVPLGTEPGGYFAGIFASAVPPEEKNNGDVAVETQVGSLLLVRVSGAVTESTEILEFFTKDKKSVFTSLPVDFYFRFQNSGQSWAKPLGDLIIKNMAGKTTKVIPANPDGSNVLPKSIRRFEASWLTNSGDEIQDKKAERPPAPPQGYWNKVKHEWKYFALGRYAANLSLTYNNDTNTTTKATTAFWVVPVHFLSVVVPAGIFALIILRFSIKRYNRHIITRSQKQLKRK